MFCKSAFQSGWNGTVFYLSGRILLEGLECHLLIQAKFVN